MATNNTAINNAIKSKLNPSTASTGLAKEVYEVPQSPKNGAMKNNRALQGAIARRMGDKK